MTSDTSDEGSDVGPTLRQCGGADEFEFAERGYSVLECRECDNVALTVPSTDDRVTCHGREMDEIAEWEMEVNTPDLRQVLLDAFGPPKTGLDICLCVIGEGPMSPGEVADILDYDGSTVTRYLNELVRMGLLQKNQLNREDGGVVNVYHSIDLERMRRETLVGFFVRAGEAASLIEEANVTKEEYLGGDHAEGLQEVFWGEFRDDS